MVWTSLLCYEYALVKKSEYNLGMKNCHQYTKRYFLAKLYIQSNYKIQISLPFNLLYHQNQIAACLKAQLIINEITSHNNFDSLFNLINYIMKKQSQLKYVRTTYQIFVYSITYQNHFKLHFSSENSGVQHQTKSQATSKISKCFQLNSVDIIYEGQRTKDSTIHLQLLSNQMDISTITFDVKKQKFVKGESKSLFRKTFNDKSGYIDYKFLTAKVQIISYYDFCNQQQKRNRIILRKGQDYKTIKKQNDQYEQIQKEKDRMIQDMQQKLKSLLQQNINLNKKINERPLNIMVNIQGKKDFNRNNDNLLLLDRGQRAYSSDGKYLEQITKQLQQEKGEKQYLKEKIYSLEIHNKQLEEKCNIFLEGMKGFDNKQKSKKIQKKLAQVDNQYLLAKAISNYDQSFKKEIQKKDIEEMRKSMKQFNNLLQTQPQKRTKDGRDGREAMITSMLRNNSMLNSNIMNSRNQKPKESMHKIRVLTELNQIKESMVSQAPEGQIRQSKEEFNIVKGQLLRKQKQIELLQNDLKKKINTIEKLIHKQNQYQRQYQEYQQQKSKLFTNLALSSINSANTPPDQIQTIKKLTSYNSQLIKERQKLQEQIRVIKLQNLQKNKKIDNFELITRKSLLFMSQISKQKDILQQKIKDKTDSQAELIIRKSQNDSIKQQLIQCQQELSALKVSLQQQNSQGNIKLKQQNQNMNKELTSLKLQNQRLKIIVDQQNAYQSKLKLLQDKYQQIQKLQKGLKSFVLRLQSHINSQIKKKDEQIYKSQMKSLMKQTYSRINDFENDYYQVLIDAAKLSEQSIINYYDSLSKYKQEMAQSIEKQQKMWSDRLNLLKERDKAIQEIKQKQQNLIVKKQKKLLLIQDEFQHFVDSFKRVNNRINQLQTYKISLKQILLQDKSQQVSKSNVITIPVPKISNSNLMESMEGKNQKQKNDASQLIASREGGKNKKYRQESVDQLQKSKMMMMNSKIAEHLNLKESFARHLMLREDLARQKLQSKKRQATMVEEYQLKIKDIQKKVDKQVVQIQNRATKRQQQLQQALNKAYAQMQSKTQYAQNQLAKITSQANQLREQVISLKQLIERAGEELTFLQDQNTMKESQNNQLLEIQRSLTWQLEDYKQTQIFLLRKIKQIQEIQKADKEEVNRKLEQRSDNFLKIQNAQEGKIYKLKEVVYQLQYKLQQQINQNIRNKYKIEQLNEEISNNNNTIKQQRQETQILLQSLQKQLQNQREMKEHLQNQNNQYHRHVIELSDLIAAHQKEILQLNIIIQSHNKEKSMLQEISARFVDKQSSLKQESKKIQQVGKQKNEQIRKWQSKYENLNQEISFLQRQSQNTKKQSVALKQENLKLKEQLFEKQREIIAIQTQSNALANQKGIVQIHIQKLKMQVDQLSTTMVNQENKIKELTELNEQLMNDKNGQGIRISEKSRRSKEDTDSFLDKSRQMKVSRRSPQVSASNLIGSNQKGSESLRYSQGDKNRGLLVPIMKTNKMLNLPSVDSDPIPDEEYNLHIIEEHQQQLNDTFFKDKNMQINVKNQQNVTIQRKSIHQTQVLNQSGVHISFPQRFTEDQIGLKMTQPNKKELPKNVHFNQSSEVITESVGLKKIFEQGKKQLEQSVTQKGILKSQRSTIYNKSNQDFIQISKQKDVSNTLSLQSRQSQKFLLEFEERTKQLSQQIVFLNQNIREYKQQKTNDELYIEEIQEKLRMAEKLVQQQEKNVEELMKEIQKISQINTVLQNQIQRQKQNFLNLIQQHKDQIYDLEQKLEESIGDNLKKESIIYDLQLQKGKFKEKQEKIMARQIQRQEKFQQAVLRMKQSQNKLKKYQQSYMKYQQQSQLQILKLKEQIDSIQQKLRNKQEQLMFIGQKYVQLQERNRSLLIDLKQQEVYFEESQKGNSQLHNKFQSTKKQIQGHQAFRKNTLKKIHQIELQNYQLAQQLSNAVRNAAIQSQKWNIKLTVQKEVSEKCQQKIKDKQKTILQLKHQIAIYNEQCDELKRLNETLSLDIIKAQKELKQIMQQYDAELQAISSKVNDKHFTTNELKKNTQNLLQQIQSKNKQIKVCKEQIKSLNHQNSEIRNNLQVLKLQKNKITINLSKKLEFEKDQRQKLISKLTTAQKDVEEMNLMKAQAEQKSIQANRLLNDTVRKLQEQNGDLKLRVENLSKKQKNQQKQNKKDFMLSILEGKLQQKTRQIQLLKSKKYNQRQTQQIAKSYQNQIEKLSNIIVNQKQKSNNIYQQLKQVIKSFKKLQDDNSLLKQKYQKLKKNNQSISHQYRQIDKKLKQYEYQNEQLHKQNEELQKQISSLRFSRLQSFSKSNADTTIR